MLAVGDPQVKNNEQVGYFREEGIADMRKLMAADASKRYFALIWVIWFTTRWACTTLM